MRYPSKTASLFGIVLLGCAGAAIAGLLLAGALDSSAGAQSRDCLSRREYVVNPRTTSYQFHDREDGKIRVEHWYSETEETWLVQTCDEGRKKRRSLYDRFDQSWMGWAKVWPDDFAESAIEQGWGEDTIAQCSEPRHLIGRGRPRSNTCWRVVFAVVEGRAPSFLSPAMRMPPE